MGMEIRPYQSKDSREWLRMRRALWPDVGLDEEKEAADWLAQSDSATFVAVRPEGGLAGFAEFGTRARADGCEHAPVAYLEGWYVDPDVRQRGIGEALLRAGEAWAVGKGIHELASDARIENTVSHCAHMAVGFEEVERVILYRKVLRGRATDNATGDSSDSENG
jgi:aminoglycoside 6'-N-acetyltransferase I